MSRIPKVDDKPKYNSNKPYEIEKFHKNKVFFYNSKESLVKKNNSVFTE